MNFAFCKGYSLLVSKDSSVEEFSKTFSVPIAFLLSYLVGSLPFGYIIGRVNGIDIRRHGSGNIGATNVLRTLGRRWGYLCFLLDFLKGLAPVLASYLLSRRFAPDSLDAIRAAALAGTFSGHVWTIFLGFKGGKGVATAAGAISAISPLSMGASLLVWMAVFSISRFVSLSSIVASVALPAAYFLAAKFAGGEFSPLLFSVFTAISVLSIIKHRSNIARLANGTEMRFGRKEEK